MTKNTLAIFKERLNQLTHHFQSLAPMPMSPELNPYWIVKEYLSVDSTEELSAYVASLSSSEKQTLSEQCEKQYEEILELIKSKKALKILVDMGLPLESTRGITDFAKVFKTSTSPLFRTLSLKHHKQFDWLVELGASVQVKDSDNTGLLEHLMGLYNQERSMRILGAQDPEVWKKQAAYLQNLKTLQANGIELSESFKHKNNCALFSLALTEENPPTLFQYVLEQSPETVHTKVSYFGGYTDTDTAFLFLAEQNDPRAYLILDKFKEDKSQLERLKESLPTKIKTSTTEPHPEVVVRLQIYLEAAQLKETLPTPTSKVARQFKV